MYENYRMFPNRVWMDCWKVSPQQNLRLQNSFEILFFSSKTPPRSFCVAARVSARNRSHPSITSSIHHTIGHFWKCFQKTRPAARVVPGQIHNQVLRASMMFEVMNSSKMSKDMMPFLGSKNTREKKNCRQEIFQTSRRSSCMNLNFSISNLDLERLASSGDSCDSGPDPPWVICQDHAIMKGIGSSSSPSLDLLSSTIE